MFSQLFFLILLLLSLSTHSKTAIIQLSHLESFGFILLFFNLLLAQFTLLKNWKEKKIERLFQIQFILFSIFFHFVFAIHTHYQKLAFFNFFHSFSFLGSYFTLLFFIYSKFEQKRAFKKVLFLIPFIFPYLLFNFFTDLIDYLPIENNSYYLSSIGFSLLVFCCFIALLMLFFPYLVQKIWRCQEIEEPELKIALQEVCEKAKFTHGGIKTWGVLNHLYTAAIIGIAAPFRYILLTKRLIHYVPPKEIEAILAHEIGHSYRKHLLIYPFILFGGVLSFIFLHERFSLGIEQFLLLQEKIEPKSLLLNLSSFFFFFSYALFFLSYFRIVFGFFSRRFERQADLHVFHLQMEPRYMISALNYVGILSGNTHKEPSWHHYSIEERMNYLTRCIEDPKLVKTHHKNVKKSLYIYFSILFTLIVLLIAPIMQNKIALFKSIYRTEEIFDQKFSDWLTENQRETIALQWIEQNKISKDQDKIISIVKQALTIDISVEGNFEFYVSQLFFNKKEYPLAAKMMLSVWQTVDFKEKQEEIYQFSLQFTEKILRQISQPQYKEIKNRLNQAMKRAKQKR